MRQKQKKKYPDHVVPSDEEYARLSAESYRQLKDAHKHMYRRRPPSKMVVLWRQWTRKLSQQRQDAARAAAKQATPPAASTVAPSSSVPTQAATQTTSAESKPKPKRVYTPDQMERDRKQLAFEAAQRARERQMKARFFEMLNSPAAYIVAFLIGVLICWYMAKHR